MWPKRFRFKRSQFWWMVWVDIPFHGIHVFFRCPHNVSLELENEDAEISKRWSRPFERS